MAEAEYTTVADVLAAYQRGNLGFPNVRIERANFRNRELWGTAFLNASLRAGNFEGAGLDEVLFLNGDLTEATLTQAHLYRTQFERTSLSGARLVRASVTAARFFRVDLVGADLTGCSLRDTNFVGTDFSGATLDAVVLRNTAFADADISRFCDAAGLTHEGPSYIDFRSVLRSYHHPGLKRFLVDCGVPPSVAEYAIDAARADGEGALESLMRSTFISYGGPDEPFARRLYEALRMKHVTTFFFPETARLGRRIGDEVHSRIQEHDRVILVCSRDSLDRPGVRNEIQETFDREARDGGATYLLPIMLDDYVLTGWRDPLAGRVRDRVVGDFRGAMGDERAFDRAMRRLLAALRKTGAD